MAALATLAAGVAAQGLQQVLLVGNNWEGTATVLRSTFPYTPLGKINMIPDKDVRIRDINADPIGWIFYMAIRNSAGEGNDQYVDDLYATPDGQNVVASRPSFSDVVSINLATGAVKWRFWVPGYRSDHMAVSPDGTQVAVSASLSKKVFILDINTGRQLGSFDSGDKPHENFWIKDSAGRWVILNASIGNVETDLDDPFWDWTKGDRHITIANATDFKIIRTIDIREKLDQFGSNYKNFSDAVRPAVFTPDYSKFYFQVSFFNGFFEYDFASDRITRVANLPGDPTLSPNRSDWLLDSRHHGLSIDPTGNLLCVAGTMDSYATIVDRTTFAHKTLVPADKPYWATVSGDGKHCFISEAGGNRTTAIDFATGAKVISIPVGWHPQRVRIARIPSNWKPLI